MLLNTLSASNTCLPTLAGGAEFLEGEDITQGTGSSTT